MTHKSAGERAVCPDCGTPTQPTATYKELFCWSWRSYEFRLWKWVDEPWCPECGDRDQQRQRDIESKIYDEGCNDGYEQAMREWGYDR